MRGVRLLVVGCSCAAALCSVATGASRVLGARAPTNPLVQADARTAAAKSVKYGMTVRVAQAGHASAFAASGAEFLRLHEATMTLDTRKLDPAVGNEKMMLIGSRVYVHLGFMDSSRARRAHIKPWIVLNLKAAAGYDPWSLGSLKALGAVKDVVATGAGIDGGILVHRYMAKVDLRATLALDTQLDQLVKRLGISSRLFQSTVTVGFDIGDDGYLHRFAEAFTLPVPGQAPVTFRFDMSFSGYNEPEPALVEPPTSEVMTLSQFERLTGVQLPTTA